MNPTSKLAAALGHGRPSVFNELTIRVPHGFKVPPRFLGATPEVAAQIITLGCSMFDDRQELATEAAAMRHAKEIADLKTANQVEVDAARREKEAAESRMHAAERKADTAKADAEALRVKGSATAVAARADGERAAEHRLEAKLDGAKRAAAESNAELAALKATNASALEAERMKGQLAMAALVQAERKTAQEWLDAERRSMQDKIDAAYDERDKAKRAAYEAGIACAAERDRVDGTVQSRCEAAERQAQEARSAAREAEAKLVAEAERKASAARLEVADAITRAKAEVTEELSRMRTQVELANERERRAVEDLANLRVGHDKAVLAQAAQFFENAKAGAKRPRVPAEVGREGERYVESQLREHDPGADIVNTAHQDGAMDLRWRDVRVEVKFGEVTAADVAKFEKNIRSAPKDAVCFLVAPNATKGIPDVTSELVATEKFGRTVVYSHGTRHRGEDLRGVILAVRTIALAQANRAARDAGDGGCVELISAFESARAAHRRACAMNVDHIAQCKLSTKLMRNSDIAVAELAAMSACLSGYIASLGITVSEDDGDTAFKCPKCSKQYKAKKCFETHVDKCNK